MADRRVGTVGAALEVAAGSLKAFPGARLEAEVLLAHVLGVSRARVLACVRDPLSAEAWVAFERLVARRAAGEPLAYLTGRAWFYGLPLEVCPGVLVPRPETECLAEWAIQRAQARGGRLRALDVGTGSGALALALASRVAGLRVWATDVSPEAVALARRNAARLGLEEQVEVCRADLLPPAPGVFDLVVANLPYVATADPDLAPEVEQYEPAGALFAGVDGLELIRRLLAVLPARLAPGADVGLEVGWRQGLAVVRLVEEALPDHRVRLRQDLAGRDRVVTAEGKPCLP